MNKPITRVFTRRYGGWVNHSLDAEICNEHVNRLWDIPDHIEKIWVTASTVPNPGYSFRLHSHIRNTWDHSDHGYTVVEKYRYGWDLSLSANISNLLSQHFDKPRLHITVEY